jgi:serine/threonine protein kinase
VGQTHRSTRTLGTVSHMAPELLRLGRMSSAADVYAFGIMSEWLLPSLNAWHAAACFLPAVLSVQQSRLVPSAVACPM